MKAIGIGKKNQIESDIGNRAGHVSFCEGILEGSQTSCLSGREGREGWDKVGRTCWKLNCPGKNIFPMESC